MSSGPPSKGPKPIARLGKYEVLVHVATGGMGAVYKALDTETGREVALKVLPPEMAAKPILMERFRREAKHAAKLHHDNVVTTYEFQEISGTCFLAMEFVEGIDLAEYVARKGKLDPEEARRLLIQACRGLRHAHKRGIVHRDIKPSNFLLTRKDGRHVLKLTDLGLAREADGEESRVTRAGTTVGTVDYMSPEQARDSGKADARSDLYSLGCTWYHLLAGQPPFGEGGLTEKLYKHSEAEPPNVRDLNPVASEESARMICRLLAKRPEDRYQTASELLRELKALTARARPESRREDPPPSILDVPPEPLKEEPRGARPESATGVGVTHALRGLRACHTPSSRSVRKGKKSKGDRSTTETKTKKTTTIPAPSARRWYVAGAAATIVVVGALVFALRGSGGQVPNEGGGNDAPPSVEAPATPRPGPLVDAGTPGKPDPPTPGPTKPRWPSLYHPSAALDVEKLRREVEGPWLPAAPVPADAPIFRVVRVPRAGAGPVFSSLAAACAAAPADRVSIIEVSDNGPLYETPAAVTGRSLVVRAGKGYRPLLVWDVQRTREEMPRKAEPGKTPEAADLALLSVTGGSLTLEGIDVAVKWPEGGTERVAILRVTDGDLRASGCTFSLAGKRPDGIALARLRGERAEPCRCRFDGCYGRGTSLVALDVDVPRAEVLLDGCLLVGGEPPLLQVRAGKKRPATLRVARSTLISGQTMLRLRPTPADDTTPGLNWFGWDALLSRSSGREEGTLFDLPAEVTPRAMTWRAVNCIYAGWRNLMTGSARTPASDLGAWHTTWGEVEGDGVARDPWPAAAFNDLAEIPTATYRTADTPVGFASSTAPDRPLGCDLDALPPVRDNWLPLTYDRFGASPPEPLTDAVAPDIPDPGDGLYHGERLDLNQVELGAYLQSIQRRRQLGPRVVLHLHGTGEKPITPVRVKGTHLVLYFGPPAEDAAPLVLTPSGLTPVGQDALIEVDGGNLDVIGADLRLPDFRLALVPAHLLNVRGGDLRLFGCRLQGPQQQVPSTYQGLITLEGSGETERARACAINQCVLVSPREGVKVKGVGARLRMEQTVLAAGTDAIGLEIGSGFKGRANSQCLLEHVTVAAKRAVVHLAGPAYEGVPAEPVVVQTRDCAFLNPFAGSPNRAGLLLADGEALARGLLVWQGDGDALDKRLHFGAAVASAPEQPETPAAWTRLWGPMGVRRPVLDLQPMRLFDADRWQLDRLAVRPRESSSTRDRKPPGADLAQLGIVKKPAR
jgi:serine/threonine-protein kinase